MGKFTKRHKVEIELRVLWEHARSIGDVTRCELIAQYVEVEDITPQNCNAKAREIFHRLRRNLRNELVHNGKSRHLLPTLSEGHLHRLLSNALVRRDRRMLHPRWAEYLLFFFLPKDQRDSVPGDLVEEYRTVLVPKFGVRAARWWFVKQVASSLWPLLSRRVLKALGILSLVRYFRW